MSQDKPASRIIALEEAFLHPKIFEFFSPVLQRTYAPVKSRLMDVGPDRIARMDAAGIDMQVLSHVQPGIQCIEDPAVAVTMAQEINDWLHGIVQTYPTRFAGFAALPTQNPQAAADELERAVGQLGFVGALINGHTHGRYLDHESFAVLFARAEALDVPIYIHPVDPPQVVIDTYYNGDSAMVTGWGWPVETGTHLLKMIAGGVFDRHPRLKIIVGHMGELLPYCFTRLNVALTMGEWLRDAMEKKQAGNSNSSRTMEKNLRYYMRENIYITTSGVFDVPVFECALAFLGLEHILFSVDDPFQDNFDGVQFLRDCKLAGPDKERLAHGNAERLLKLPTQDSTAATAAAPSKTMRSSMIGLRAKTQAKVGKALISLLVK